MKRLRVLLVVPPNDNLLKKILGVGGPPLGIGYLGAYLKRGGHEVKLIDSLIEDYTYEVLKEKIKEFEPHIVGISVLTATVYKGYSLAQLVKEIDSNIKTVIGGPHVTFLPEETLRECPYLDFVVIGEGEETLLELTNELSKSEPQLENVKGIAWRRSNGEIVTNPPRPLIEDLDSIPFPAYELLPMDKYRIGKKLRIGTMITSRGCPFGCIFCSSSELFGKRWRGRSPENVVDEMELLVKKYGINDIEMLDDTFTLNRPRAIKIAELIKKRHLNHISWSCSSRVDTFDVNLATALREAGCYRVYMGIESGSQKSLDTINKGITVEKAKSAVNIARTAGLEVIGSFIIGIPGETKKDIIETIKLARKLRIAYAQFTILTPYPGTSIFDYATKHNLLITKDWSNYGIVDSVMKVPNFTSKELTKYVRKAYISFYLNPHFWWEQIIHGRIDFIVRVVKGFLKVQWKPPKSNEESAYKLTN